MLIIGGVGWLVGRVVMMMPGGNCGGASPWPFPLPAAAEYPSDHQQRQPEKHQVKVNAVILNLVHPEN